MVNRTNWLVIIATIVVAFILTLLPMPEWTIWFRPIWVLMVLMYWSIALPYRIGIGAAWLAGMFLDVLNGTLLGEHALAMTVVVYLVVRSHTRLRMFPLLQQGFSICVLLLLYQFILFCIQGFLGELPRSWFYWSASFTSMLLWPWVSTLLRDCQYRFKVT